MNKIKIISALLIVMTIFAGCGRKSENRVIQVKGSDTILNLTQKVTEEFLKENPKSKISVTGGGSGTGIAAKLNKTADVAMASREIKDEELAKATENNVKIKLLFLADNFNNPWNPKQEYYETKTNPNSGTLFFTCDHSYFQF